jgi:hypothetical protein
MTYAHSVAIGPEFFKKAFHDYSDKSWAFAREILQNSIDCGSGTIRIWVGKVGTDDDPATHVTVENDGAPMTREIIVDKLLSLGSSGKDFQAGSVGGFGKAKEILYFAHDRYEIESGVCVVKGSGAMYDLGDSNSFRHGTRSDVRWRGDHHHNLRSAFKRFVELCGCAKVKFFLDSEELTPGVVRKHHVRDLEKDGKVWARVHTTTAFDHQVVVRVGGIPMFSEKCDYRKGLVLELEGASSETLTSNRDSLRWPFAGELSSLITKVAVDRRSAFKLEEVVYQRLAGPKLQRKPDEPESSKPGVLVALAAKVAEPESGPNQDIGGIEVAIDGQSEQRASFLPYEFIVKNCVRRPVPEAFDPYSLRFGDHAAWLVNAWAGCLIELYELFRNNGAFSVGWVFSPDFEAEFEHGNDYGRVYYLNPVVFKGRRPRRRFTKQDRGRIASIAAHEFVHGGLGESYHGEDFANKLTDVMGIVVRNWRQFARHF